MANNPTVSCSPNDLTKNSACFQCLSEGEHLRVQTYLLSVIAGGSQDPETLVKASKAFAGLSYQQLLMIQVYLMCQITGG